jgi:hypothetical protein
MKHRGVVHTRSNFAARSAAKAVLSALLLSLPSCKSAKDGGFGPLEPPGSGAVGGGGAAGSADAGGADQDPSPNGGAAGSLDGTERDAGGADQLPLLDGGTAPIPPDSVFLPNHFVPEYATSDGRDVVFLFARDSDHILRWSRSANDLLSPIPIDAARGTPGNIAYSPESDRLYIGYDSGQVTFVDAALEEHDFAQMTASVTGLVAAGDFVVVEDTSGDPPEGQCYEGEPPCPPPPGSLPYSFVRYFFDGQGRLTDMREDAGHSAFQAYDPMARRVFLLTGAPSADRFQLWSEQLDASGSVVSFQRAVSTINFEMLGPIRVSPDGAQVHLGTRDTFDAGDLVRQSAMLGSAVDAQWLSAGAIATLSAVPGGSLIERRDAGKRLVERMTVGSRPIALVPSGDNHFILVGAVGRPGQLVLTPWVPNDDSDGDGTPNVLDGFPWEPAAALDSDRDGAPDA